MQVIRKDETQFIIQSSETIRIRSCQKRLSIRALVASDYERQNTIQYPIITAVDDTMNALYHQSSGQTDNEPDTP